MTVSPAVPTATPSAAPSAAATGLPGLPVLPVLQIDVWSDVACPWCFIGKRRFEGALEAFEHRAQVEVTWRSYQLSPDAEVGSPHTEAELLAEHKNIPIKAVREMFEQVTALAAAEGLTYDFDTVRPANTFDAHRLIHLAAPTGHADAVIEALMTAHFSHGTAVDDHEELVALAERCGLVGDDVRAALAGNAAGEAAGAAVLADIDQARAIGVTGVPFFAFDRRFGVAGAQSSELFADALNQAWAGLELAPELA
ncbi:DsbA family oxidoreductase [Pengzhenrongella frigida]|uniref:DsbA family oxidoreductase n=1 Tax=Pengzhenrongella frigida TaxID=1259133 RepID=A0A4Q5MVB0_9MICO|nr:DsbA family oxidoreductase [Cellulomonas sp. HLT2-17]RYV49450.1 DsbA family oxidoreductase [Cellulomonas sp. HLT2-17]